MNAAGLVLHRLNPWMDLDAASDYSGVPVAELLAAASSGALAATVTHPRRPGEWMVRMDDIDMWVQRRSAPVTSQPPSPAIMQQGRSQRDLTA